MRQILKINIVLVFMINCKNKPSKKRLAGQYSSLGMGWKEKEKQARRYEEVVRVLCEDAVFYKSVSRVGNEARQK